LPRGKVSKIYDENQKFELGKATQIGSGTDATIFATGVAVEQAAYAMKELKEKGTNIRVVDICSIKPIDKELIVKCAKETNKLISVEDHSVIGGLGSVISDVLCENYPKELLKLGVYDKFGRSGSPEELMKCFKIDKEAIINAVK
jgi:transketolase